MSPCHVLRWTTIVLGLLGCERADGASYQGVRPLVVRHATVLDTRTATTLRDRAIVMRGERIVRVVPDSALES
ncbi:MAG TPA: hypothetical protein VM076_12760, partial [Gemmatimonadaceae bacterium]|nr:hypothetical protein [Gemmatimonadaceae bacterium]